MHVIHLIVQLYIALYILCIYYAIIRFISGA